MGRLMTPATAEEVWSWLSILGLRIPCTRADIDAAFRRLARVHHPDHGGRPDDFKRIKQAHDRLCELLPRMGVR